MLTIDPPFFYGGPVPTARAGKHLHGFEEERRTIVQYLNRRTQVRLGIFGGPRSGKTSVLLAVANEIPSLRVHLDCAKIWPNTLDGFYRLLLDALEVRAADGALSGPPAQAFLRLPVVKRGGRGVLVLENAHHLRDIDEALLAELPILAVRVPYHFVLTGNAGALGTLVEASLELKPFSEGTSNDFLRRRLSSVGLNVADDALAVLYEFTRGEPDLLQRIGLIAWRQANQSGATRITAEAADAAVGELVEQLPTETVASWSAVRGIMRDAFIAMCLYDLESPTDIANRLGAEPKNVIVLLSRLATGHGLVERAERGKYRVRNPLLKHYVRKEFGSPLLR